MKHRFEIKKGTKNSDNYYSKEEDCLIEFRNNLPFPIRILKRNFSGVEITSHFLFQNDEIQFEIIGFRVISIIFENSENDYFIDAIIS